MKQYANCKTGVDRIARSNAAAPSRARRDLKIAYLPPDRLRRAAANARTHSKKQLGQIAQSIARFGFVNPVLISDDFEIIAGHGRVEAAKMLGLKQVPTLRLSNLSPADRRAYVIADNRLAQLAGWDRELLAIELQGLVDLKFDDIKVTGFSLPQIEVILQELDNTNSKQADQPPDANRGPTVCQPNDRWLLGRHRLVCGDGDLAQCDVIIEHWQRYSSQPARLEGADLNFDAAKAGRRPRRRHDRHSVSRARE
jgi:ParB-like nuclease domain